MEFRTKGSTIASVIRASCIQILRLLLLAACLCAPLALFAADSGPTVPPDLKVARVNPFVFVRSDGTVYVVSGNDSQGKTILDSEVYSLATGSVLLPQRSEIQDLGYTMETAALLPQDRILVCKVQNCEILAELTKPVRYGHRRGSAG